MKKLVDSFERTIRKLRISVTDHCNLRCHYCMPEEGLNWLKQKEILSYEEIFFLSEIFVDHGVQHIRLTGGEPLLRKNIDQLVSMLSQLKNNNLKSIGLTTNGILLGQYAQKLKDSGLDHVNISLDTVNPQRYLKLTKRDLYQKVIDSIKIASQVFPHQCKLNAVIEKGFNEPDIIPLVDFARQHHLELRFIEKMPLEAQLSWQRESIIAGETIKNIVHQQYPLNSQTKSERGSSPAQRHHISNSTQAIGFINSVTEPFCQQCDRIRLTADGALRNCLFTTSETDLKIPLRSNMSREKLVELIKDNIYQKWAGHHINEANFERASRSMSQIGG